MTMVSKNCNKKILSRIRSPLAYILDDNNDDYDYYYYYGDDLVSKIL